MPSPLQTLLDAKPLGDDRFEARSIECLSHGMWFHRPFRIDEWLLYSQHVASSAGGRAIARGSVFTRDGVLVASVVQEGLSQIAPGDSAMPTKVIMRHGRAAMIPL